ncbi:MAG: DNA polymerase III subunit alpha [Cardiobacteriaceae bacterium]|nr:DNA polymerase III subunit alpha [Cardiobacteriaceae bacterium]
MFTHLHTHSEYSIIDSLLTIDDLVKFASEQGMHSLALTDRNNLFGAVKFYKAARSKGIKPILGCDLSIRDERGEVFQLVLLAKNREGFKALCRLLSSLHLDEEHTHKALSISHLQRENCQDLIALSGGMEGDVGLALLRGDVSRAHEKAQHWQTIFGGNYHLQITALGNEPPAYQSALAELSQSLKITAVATNYACFLNAEDFEAHEIRVCISNGDQLDSPNRPRHYTENHSLKTQAELSALHPEVLLANSNAIAAECNVVLPLGEVHLPPFPTPEGQSQEEYIAQCAHDGLTKRLEMLYPNPEERHQQEPRYRERLNREIQVIQSMGFSGYFLIVMDFIQWAKEQNIPVGPGRGSGAGSLVAYSIKITDLDPLPYDLLFERFLNPERVSMPDFDIDFCMDRRDEVIHYVMDKYGHDRVCQIATHGTMAAKGVLRDVGRVLGMPYPVVDKISKMIPPVLGITLSDALAPKSSDPKKEEMRSPDLIQAYETNEEVKTLVDYALKLEGLTRSVGKHAGGVLISPSHLTDFTALYSSEGSIVSQFDKDDIEAVGLVKFDFLGLRTLTIIDWAMQHVNRQRQKMGQSALSIMDLPLDDEKTYQLLQRAETTAVFQLESQGLKELIAKMQPSQLEDLIALVALYRPGPLKAGMVDDFIKRKQGAMEISYPHPALESVLNNTYGIVVYQEQVMQIAQVLANYTLGGADELRRAMGKKKVEEMARHRLIFTEKAVQNGVDEAIATNIFNLMETFAEYGFNKSHSATYAILSYQTAWLKAHYPAEFMAAVLSSEIGKPPKIVKFLEEARAMGLQVLPPCINRSQYHFMPMDGGIVYGLGGVKGIGEGVIAYVVEEREKNGAFRSIRDFCQRLDIKRLNRRVLETLITVGAFDQLEPNRGGLLHTLPTIMAMAEKHHQDQKNQQTDLFTLLSGASEQSALNEQDLAIDPNHAWSLREQLEHEKNILGLFLSGHPLDDIKPTLRQLTSHRLSDLPELYPDDKPPEQMEREKRFAKLHLAGIITEARAVLNKRQQTMYFLTLDDGSGQIEVGVFGQVAAENKALCVEDTVVVIQAKADYDPMRQRWRFAAEQILDFQQARAGKAQQLLLHIMPQTRSDYALILRDLLVPTIKEHGVSVQLLITTTHGTRGTLTLPSYYLLNLNVLSQLESALGQQAVQLIY